MMSSPASPRPGVRMAVVGVALLLGAGCGSSGVGQRGFDDRTAEVGLGGRTTTFALDSCGLDGSTLFVVGRSKGGETLQAVVGVDADDTTAVIDSTGLTVTDEGNDLAAFGPESWDRRNGSGPAPGRITSARLRGSRIQVTGDLATVDDAGAAAPDLGDQPVPFSLDARCDDQSS